MNNLPPGCTNKDIDDQFPEAIEKKCVRCDKYFWQNEEDEELCELCELWVLGEEKS